MRKIFTFLFAALMSVSMFAAVSQAEMTVIHNWANDAADQVGTTILGTTGVEVSTVKIHENTDAIPGIKFGSSYVYADGKWIAIKPAQGGFKAGDVLSVSVVFNNSDATKYCMADVYAADGATRLFRSDSASTLNGRNAGEPIVQTYTLASDQDSLFLGRFGNTGMFITLLKVERADGGETPSTHTLQLVVNDPAMGTVEVTNLLGSDIIDNGNGTYTVPDMAQVTIMATANPTYEFTGWREGNIGELNCYYCGTAINTNDNPYRFVMMEDKAIMAVFEAPVERELAKLGINFPTENRPADNNIEMAGSFEEGTMLMEKIIETGWFVSYQFVNAAAEDNFKFRDKTNNDMVLCKFIPANGDAEGKWVQAIFKFGNCWQDDSWKGTPCKFIELDLGDGAQYAWMEGMPEPDPEDPTEGVVNTVAAVKAVKVIRNGQLFVIKNGKTYNALGVEVK